MSEIIGQHPPDNPLGNAIYRICLDDPSVKIVVEIGTWKGGGTTYSIIKGLQESNKLVEEIKFISLEVMKHFHDFAVNLWNQNLPILVVSDWSELTEDFLENKYIEMSNKQYNYRKMDIRYWASLFHSL